ncbi:hypothetical protein YPPY72_2956, partial [Yersinia pestis PY-72]
MCNFTVSPPEKAHQMNG